MSKQRRRSELPWCHSCLWFAPYLTPVGSGKCHAYGPMIATDSSAPDWPVVSSGDTCPKHDPARQEEDDHNEEESSDD